MARALLIVAWAVCTPNIDGFSCIHDDVVKENNANSHGRARSGEQRYADGGRRLASTTYTPLRIVTKFVSIDLDSVMQSDGGILVSFLRDKLVPATVARWSQLLATAPVEGALFAHRDCDLYWTDSTPYKCSVFADTTGCANNAFDEPITFTPALFGDDYNYTSKGEAVLHPRGVGTADADFVMFVTAKQTTKCGATGSGVLAYASTCQRDQFDRPTFGRVNFCPRSLDASATAWSSQYGVALHEFAHALGFSSSSWYLYRNTDAERTPRTPRHAGWPTVPSDAYKVDYNCGGASYRGYYPHKSTVNYFNERGMPCAGPDYLPPLNRNSEDCVAKAVTPNVLQVARDFFACPTLNGMELENQQTSVCDIQGSHWEQRLLNTELMASYTQHSMLVSPLTLAMMEDSSWYRANYSAADPWRAGLDWGFRQGCQFATEKCVQNGAGLGSPPHFFTEPKGLDTNTAVCTTDRRAVGYVQLITHTTSLPTQYQYFANSPAKGGSNPVTMDYCPGVTAYSNRWCGTSEHGSASAYPNRGYYGESFGNRSACFESTLRQTGLADGPGAGCFEYECFTDGSMTITTRSRTNVAATVSCGAGSVGTTKSLSGYAGVLTCPDPSILCSAVGTKLDPLVSPPPIPNSSASAKAVVGQSSASPTPAPSQWALLLNFTFKGITGAQLVNTSAGAQLRDAIITGLGAAMLVPVQALYIQQVRDNANGIATTFAWASGSYAQDARVLSTALWRDGASQAQAAHAITDAVSAPARSMASAAPFMGIKEEHVARRLGSMPALIGSCDIIVAYRLAVAEPSPDPALGSTGTAVGQQQAEDRAALAVRRLTKAMAASTSRGVYTFASPFFSSVVRAFCGLTFNNVSKTANETECISLAESGSGLTDAEVAIIVADSPLGTSTVVSSNSANAAIAIGAIVGGIALCCCLGAITWWCIRKNGDRQGSQLTGQKPYVGPEIVGSMPRYAPPSSAYAPRPMGHGAVPTYPLTQQQYMPQPGNQGHTSYPTQQYPPQYAAPAPAPYYPSGLSYPSQQYQTAGPVVYGQGQGGYPYVPAQAQYSSAYPGPVQGPYVPRQ